MNRSAWEQAKSLLADAADLSVADRERFVLDHCADPDLCREVLELLASPAPFSDIVAANALQLGERLGPYVIQGLLGSGGMGEVYKGRDTTLNRSVAIKVLPSLFASNAERLARLRREAQLLAALNHPNIAQIHGFEESTGVAALVMEFVDGPTLGDRIARRAIPAAEALAIARQITDALEAAHEQGIVHRDLKPANIKVREDGTVKVLDFGLARALDLTVSSSADPPNSQKPSVRETQLGLVLGTAPYMAPEQARGESVDQRADIWSFGCVLYEMLSGRRAFAGDEITNTLPLVIGTDPDWNALPPNTPATILKLLRRCLEKDRNRRLADVADARLDIEEAQSPSANPLRSHLTKIFTSRPFLRSDRLSAFLKFISVVGTIVVLVGVMAWLVIRNGTRSVPPVRLLTVTSFPGSEGGPSFSPDGNFVAFTWSGPDFATDGDVWVKAVEGDALRRLTNTPGVNEVMPAWSPDGAYIAFVRYEGRGNRGVYLISALGGSERKLSDSGSHPTWLPDSQSLVFEDRVGGTVAPVHYVLATGVRRPLTTPPAGFVDFNAKVSPDGRTLAFIRSTTGIVQAGTSIRAGLFVVPMAGGEAVRVDDRASGMGGPEWTPDSREIFYPRWDPSGVKVFRVAATGGTAEPAAGLPTSEYAVSISGFRPGGTFRVAVVDARTGAGLRMIDLHTPQSSGRILAWTPFCDSTRIDWPGRFSRDGAQVSFTSNRNGVPQILAANRDGTQVRTLTAFDGAVGFASWSPDRRFLVFDAVDDQNRTDLYIVGADGGPPRRLTNDDQRESNPEWSRDGRWIFYEAVASGRSEIWKIPAAGGTPVQITMQGGIDPRESPDGRSVYFLEAPSGSYGNPFWAPATLERVSVDGGNVSRVLSNVRQGRWDLADMGIVFLTGAPGLTPDPATPDALELYSFTDGRTRRLGEIPFPVTNFGYSPPRVLTASPDGRWIVVSHMDHRERDIVVADNFR